jgi:hypothetical protein
VSLANLSQASHRLRCSTFALRQGAQVSEQVDRLVVFLRLAGTDLRLDLRPSLSFATSEGIQTLGEGLRLRALSFLSLACPSLLFLTPPYFGRCV